MHSGQDDTLLINLGFDAFIMDIKGENGCQETISSYFYNFFDQSQHGTFFCIRDFFQTKRSTAYTYEVMRINMESTTLAFVNDILTGLYVLLTLILACAAIWSIRISSKQSQAAMDAVNKQIEGSEKQSKESLAVLREQIEASKEQAREALHNQYKPIINPGSRPISSDAVSYRINIKNLGAGVALNVWGVFTTVEQWVIRCTERTHLLGPNSEEVFSFNTNGAVLYPFPEFEDNPVFVQSNGNSNFSPEIHLMVTQMDAFNNNYLVFFDYNEGLGWRQWTEAKRIEKRLDQLAVKRGFLLPHQLGEE